MKLADLDYRTLALWPHQLGALEKIENYFRSRSARGALVQMPTGTGKTGIMAVLATRRSIAKPILIVCPSAALVDQLISEFSQAFWEKIGAPDPWRPEHVFKLLPSTLADLLGKLKAVGGQRAVVVGTIQAVEAIHGTEPFTQLRGEIGTILFDEGHREPAPLWAEVIRGFQVPTVLFSATPFRGDLKVFDVDEDHIHFLSFSQAADQALIRDVEVRESALSNNPTEFAKQIVAFRNRMIADRTFPAESKMIVRAGNEESVREIYEALRECLAGHKDAVLALHENFAAGKSGAVRDVPRNLKNRPEVFLVHQYKLVEGIDDPSCNMLAIYEPFENQRMLVQQVGRLTRQPQPIGTRAPKAVVLSRNGDEIKKGWDAFLTFDKACIDSGGKPPIRNDTEVLQNLVRALPAMDYIKGRFLERFDLLEDDLSEELRFPRSATVFHAQEDFKMDEFRQDVSDTLAAEDRFEHQIGQTADGRCQYHVTLRLNQTPFLSNCLFQSPSLEVTIYVHLRNKLFVYDSAGLWIDELRGVGPRVNPMALRRLLPKQRDNVVSFLSIKNTDLGPLTLRGRSLTARSLEASGVFVGEHMNVVTRATGRVDRARRTVGFNRARVRDGEGTGITAQEYQEWCEEVDRALQSRAASTPVLSRFATPVDVPAVTEPQNILVDMAELIGEFASTNGEAKFDSEGLCVEVEPEMNRGATAPFRFSLSVDNSAIDVWIKWDGKKKKYWLSSPGLSKIKAKDNDKISLVRRLNQRQPFRVITSDRAHVFVHGSFYSLNLDLADTEGAGRLVLDLITPVPELASATSEKGEPSNAKRTWQPKSLFRIIDDAISSRGGKALFGPKFPAVVCDDLATEVGDFLAVDDSSAVPRVATIVAKWKPGKAGVSAAAFYDVCAQGVKNLAYLKSDGLEIPGARDKFDKDWVLSKGKGALKKSDSIPRRRIGPKSHEFRKAFIRTRATPSADRSIWLVCAGGMLSKSKLEEEFKAHQPKANVLQFYHLVISAYSACQSVGVNLKIFSAP